MGYTTEFKGRLDFTENIEEVSQLRYLREILNCEPIEKNPLYVIHYIQFKLCEDLKGIEWDGGEKFYHSVDCVNFIIHKMKIEYPNFGLKGFLQAQGEDMEDTWELRINEDGQAFRKEIIREGIIECPSCYHKFIKNE